jgi:glucokinase
VDDDPIVLGLDFGGTKIAGAVATTTGRRVGEGTIATEPTLGARPNLTRGLALAHRLVAGRPLAAVGVSTFGIPEKHSVGLAPAIPGWEGLALGGEISAALGCDIVRLATDVKAAATAEVSSGALAGHDPALYLNLGTGLAVAIVCDGRVVSGANGAAGEIGYSLLRQVEVGRDEHLVLEEVVSGIAIAATVRERTGKDLTAAEVFANETADPLLSELIDEVVRELAFHLVNLTVAINPSRIAVGGGMVRSWKRLAGPLRRALDAGVPFPPELVVGAFPFDAALVGAVSLAVEAAEDSELTNAIRAAAEASLSQGVWTKGAPGR